MVIEMNVWAEGNLLLLSMTAHTLIQYANSTALAWNPNWYWELPQWLRLVFFMLAIVQFTFWLAALIGELVRISRGHTLVDTNQ